MHRCKFPTSSLGDSAELNGRLLAVPSPLPQNLIYNPSDQRLRVSMKKAEKLAERSGSNFVRRCVGGLYGANRRDSSS